MNTIGRPALGTIGLILSLIVLASCASATPTDSPSASPGGSPSASAPASAQPSPSPSVDGSTAPPATQAPPATPAPTAKPSSLVVRWHRSADVAAPNDSWYPWAGGGRGKTWTKLGDTYLFAVDTQGYDDGFTGGPQIWWSEDLLHWRRATIAHPATQHLSVTAVTRGGPGLVAIGTDVPDDVPQEMLWTSTDGKAWKPATESQTGLTAGQLWLLRRTASGNVSYDGAVDVTRYRGAPLEPDTSRWITVDAGDLTVFTDATDTTNKVEIWRAEGSSAWRKVGTLPKSSGATVFDAIHGSHGYFLFGCVSECAVTSAWTSVDGVTWLSKDGPTFDNVNMLIADQSGFIAVGQRVTGKGCAVADSDIFGESWTSSDGRTWRKTKEEPQFNHASIQLLIPRGRTLFGLGMRWVSDHAVPTVWTSALPNDSVTSGPAPAPTKAPPSGGCGD